MSAATRPELPQLPLSEWEATKDTLHLWLQIVGKVRKAALLAFLESAYQAGAGASGWDRSGLESSWCPSPLELSDLLEPRVTSGASTGTERGPEDLQRFARKGD